MVEHRIQVVQERQTHNLPTKDEEILALARRSGFLGSDGLKRFRETLEGHRGNVSAIYGNLFHSRDDKLRRDVSPEALFLLDPKADADMVKDMLAERRFENVERAYDNLVSLRNGPVRGNVTERIRRILEKISPLLLQELFQSPDPDMALTNLERFFDHHRLPLQLLRPVGRKPRNTESIGFPVRHVGVPFQNPAQSPGTSGKHGGALSLLHRKIKNGDGEGNGRASGTVR